MSTKRLLGIALIVGAIVGLYYAGSPPAAARSAESEGVRATLLGAPGRLAHGVGVVGARVVAPAVRNMVRSTEAELVLLQQDLKANRNPFVATSSAREGARRIAAMDSSALAHLAAGRPIQAFKNAMQANGLVTSVRQNVRAD